ncbi:FkbM family methyltransferase [Acuticoccus sp. I52.16.1]|uniref:FkbM family methyltransferase n=1 Tax=Acuticoccus sp. I52.16.1 TaxID=2928472 RepID=UPI001FCF9132|nr:FkbM family methyltransferase [Acuticoccus sp. I52.16.1]UOM36307.1 FkbM family methyltransferase [Acuticoccus sp. I52.16.1]
MHTDDDFEIMKNEYGAYAVPKSYHMRVLPKVLARGKVYEPQTIKYICDHAADGDVVTGGAFIGDFLPAISKALAPGKLVHTFEPNPLCHEACRRTIELNKLANVRLHQVAVGNKPNKLPLRVHDFDKDEPAAAQSALNARASAEDEGYIEVDVVRVDELVERGRKVSVIHLDIEGFERQALRGAGRLVRRFHPKLVIEGRRTTAEWLAQSFPKAGYQEVGAWEKNRIFEATNAPVVRARPAGARRPS